MGVNVYHQRLAVVCPYCLTTNVDRLKRQYNECGQVEDLFECHECNGSFQQMISRWYKKLGGSMIPKERHPKVWVHLVGDKYDGSLDTGDTGYGHNEMKKFRKLKFRGDDDE